MFIFKSKDKEDGKMRRRRVKVEMIEYALKLHNGDRQKASDYLGVVRRALLGYLHRYEELAIWRKERNDLNAKMYGREFKPHLWGKQKQPEDL